MRSLLAATCTFLVCLPVNAAQDDPENATRAYLKALRSEGMPVVVRFIHPDEMTKFKDMLLPVFEAEAQSGKNDLRSAVFGPTATVETVRAAAPDAFMTRFFTLITSQVGSVQFGAAEVIGSVQESPDLVHVVTRVSAGVGELEVTQLQVVSWRTYEGEWRATLSGEIEGMARQLRAQIEP